MTDIDTIKLNFGEGGMLVLDVVIAFVMFGIALDLRAADFRRVARAPRAPAIGLAAQFLVFPAVTFGLALLLEPPPSIALGMMLISACPAGSMSNVLAHLSGANTALSISLTAISTVAAIVLTPLVTTFWGSMNPATAPLLKAMSLDPARMVGTVLLVLGAPLAAGQIVAARWPEAAARLRGPVKKLSIAALLAFIAGALRANFDHFVHHIGAVALLVALQDSVALVSGYAAARAAGLPEADARAIALECGIRNAGLGLAIIFGCFDGLGGMAMLVAWWGVWHGVSGFALAYVWSRRPASEPFNGEAVPA